MTKADQIRALAAEGKKDAEIAEIVGCRREYVRTAARQRKDGMSRADRKYAPKQRARNKSCMAHGDRGFAATEARKAYRKARDGGDTIERARNKRGAAYVNAMVKTGRAILLGEMA